MHSFQHSFDQYEHAQDCRFTYDHFVKAIKSTEGLWERFVKEYGEDFTAEADHKDGWSFNPNSASLRECGLFPNHRDNHLYSFGSPCPLERYIINALENHGFSIGFNGGDEEDGLVQFKHNGFSSVV